MAPLSSIRLIAKLTSSNRINHLPFGAPFTVRLFFDSSQRPIPWVRRELILANPRLSYFQFSWSNRLTD